MLLQEFLLDRATPFTDLASIQPTAW